MKEIGKLETVDTVEREGLFIGHGNCLLDHTHTHIMFSKKNKIKYEKKQK